MGNPELLDSWTPYVYISMGLYGWLGTAAALHIPVNSLGQFGATIKQPVRPYPRVEQAARVCVYASHAVVLIVRVCYFATHLKRTAQITLLFPFFSVSFVFLVAFELLMGLFLPRLTKQLGLSWRVANVTYVRSPPRSRHSHSVAAA